MKNTEVIGLELIRGNVKVEWDNIGEGYSGDYNPDDPNDVELLRFYVSKRESDTEDWQDVEDASYCTNFLANADEALQMKALEAIMDRVYDGVTEDASIKKICEELSHISETDFEQEACMPKYIDTPVGRFDMPKAIADRLDGMTDIELLEDYFKNCKDFIDPFLFKEMADRKLIHQGDFYADIVKRLEDMKNAVMPDKDLLMKKINEELAVFEQGAPAEDRDGIFFSDLQIRTAFNNVLCNTPLSDDMIAALYKKDDVLFDMRDFYARIDFHRAGFEPDDFYEVTYRYLEKQERYLLSVKLMSNVESERTGRLYDLRQELPNDPYEKAKEIYLCSEIVSALSYDDDFSLEQLRALAAMKSPLSEIYNECLHNDLDLSDKVSIIIESTIQEHSGELNEAEWDAEADNDYEQEGLDEP